MNIYERRINLNVPLEKLSKMVCEHYNFGEFIDNKLIEVGYEDFNYVLTTSTGKYLVKVFALFRTLNECKDVADKATIPYENGFSCPKIFKVEGNNVFQTILNNNNYRLMVMEYINGSDMLSLNIIPNLEELKEIATQLANLNKIQFIPPKVYDPWSIIDFPVEYEKHKKILTKTENKELYQLKNELDLCDFSKLKYGFVHGDLWTANIIKDKIGKLYYIDFCASNYLPRVIDVAISIVDLCLDVNDLEISKIRIKTFLKAYEAVSKLTKYEKECLKTFMKIHEASSLLNTIREKHEGNNTVSNQETLENSRLKLFILNSVNLIN